MTWDALGDLRSLLNDDQQGNIVKSKAVFPTRDAAAHGLYRRFYTLEDRLVCSGAQDLADQPLRVWEVNVSTDQEHEVALSGIFVTDALRGEFTLSYAPSGKVRAGYCWREWYDGDLERAISQGVRMCNATSADTVVDGLRMAATYFAAEQAHRRAAHRWQQRRTEQFLLEDQPAQNEMERHVAFHTQQATELHQLAMAMRKEYYATLGGQNLRPAYATLTRIPRPYTPRR